MKVLDGCSGRVNLASVDNPGETVAVLLKAAVRLRVQFAEFLERYEMTEGKYAVLTALDRAGSVGLSQAAVAEELMHSESNVSTLIDRLHHDGLVDRRWSNTDRRKRVLLLTPAGQVVVDQIEAGRHCWAEDVLSRITSNDRRVLVTLLKQLTVRRDADSPRQPARRPLNRVRAPASCDSGWEHQSPAVVLEPTSPQSALERMLSNLGVAGRFAEDEH